MDFLTLMNLERKWPLIVCLQAHEIPFRGATILIWKWKAYERREIVPVKGKFPKAWKENGSEIKENSIFRDLLSTSVQSSYEIEINLQDYASQLSCYLSRMQLSHY